MKHFLLGLIKLPFFILIGFFAFIAFTVIFFVDFIVGLGKGEFPQD